MNSKINILIPTDFSANAQNACEYTMRQFDQEKTKYILYHAVIQPRSYGGMLVNITDLMLSDSQDRLDKEVQRLKEKFGGKLKIKCLAKVGYLEQVVPLIIRKELIDLVAIGTQGEGSLSSKVLGSNAEHIIRRSSIPVLAIPDISHIQDVKHVVIATEKDLIPRAECVEKILNSIMHQLEVSVLTILTSDSQKAPKSLELNRRFLPVHIEKAKKPMEGIQHFLNSNVVDLLVVYHVQNTRLDYLFRRSITKRIASSLQIPLLVLQRNLPAA